MVQDELPVSLLMQFEPGSIVALVFDTDKDETEHLKNNIKLLKSLNFKVEVLTILQVLNFEDETERATDVTRAQDLHQEQKWDDFKGAVNRMKEKEFRNALKRHKLDMNMLWNQKPPKAFRFNGQDSEKIKSTD